MRIFAGLLLFFAALWGSNLSTYNVYERSDRVDIMLSFDAPYSGTILQERKDGAITLLFKDLQNDQNIEKSVNSSILQELLFEPRGQNLALVIKSDAQVAVSASKTTDGFGLRIRVTPENAANSAAAPAGSTARETCPTGAPAAPAAGGRAAVSTGGALVAEEGLGLAAAGARLSVSQDAQDVGVYALPGSIIACDGQATLTTERPWGVLVTAAGVIGPAEGEADVDLTDMLALAQAMGPRPGL